MTPRPSLDPALASTMLRAAFDEGTRGLSEGGILIGAALFHRDGTLLGSGHNRRVQENDASNHAETRLPHGGTATRLSRLRDGDHAVTVLVLLGPRASIQHRRGRDR